MKQSSTYSVAIPDTVHAQATGHLLRPDRQEDLCFALWHPSRGKTRTTALVQKLALPQSGERLIHGNASFLPEYFERAVSEAASAGAGLAFMHSHPSSGWQDMSRDDIRAEETHAPGAYGATGLPLVGMTLGTDGSWSARVWKRVGTRKYERKWCTHVRVVGERLAVTFADQLVPPPKPKVEQLRTVSSWGQRIQADLARLRVGIIGAGSVGSIVAEALARTGIARITLLDFDSVEFVNLDRLLHATRLDALLRRPKVWSLARGLRRSATADDFWVDELEWSVCEEEGYRAALDCDILFSCVDRPWGRSVLNFIAYAHLVPVVDGGIRVESKPEGLQRADWKAHIVGPGRRCLECLEQYNSGLVPVERDGYFDDPSYIQGLPADHEIRRSENVFAFSLSAASFEVLQALMMIIAPLGIASPGPQTYHFVPGLLDQPKFDPCNKNCLFPNFVAQGDHASFALTGQHLRAEQVRAERAAGTLPWRGRLAAFFERLAERFSRSC